MTDIASIAVAVLLLLPTIVYAVWAWRNVALARLAATNKSTHADQQDRHDAIAKQLTDLGRTVGQLSGQLKRTTAITATLATAAGMKDE